MADQAEDFDATPEGAAKRWIQEFKAAREALEKWHTTAKECETRYRDEEDRDGQALNLYASGIDLKEATLYGNTPTVDVSRRYNDQNDDVARVASELWERLLNGDLERDEEMFPKAIGMALKDWLIPGFGLIWERLERETEKVDAKPAILGPDGTEQAAAVPETTRIVSEDVATDYVYWKDVLYSPARVFSDLRWAARKALMSEKSFKAKFGDEKVPYAVGADPKDATIPKTPWARAEVWEIWDKEGECVWWWVENHTRVLTPIGLKGNDDGSVPDPLGLTNFWPFPEPIIDGADNSQFVPRPSYARAQDIYRSVDDKTTRISLLSEAVDASCVYDKTVGELGELLNSKGENKALPAANYKALAEKGGIAACVSWKPLKEIVEAMTVLRDLRREDIDLLFQVDGTSDIMRGQATEGGATATEQAIKAKYGSIRGGKAQKRFAQFCSDAQRIRAEIIAKHFDPQTIAVRANVQGLPQNDQALAEQAIQLIKSDFARFRIVVKAESVSLTDYAANKQESMDVVGMIGQFMMAVQPLAQAAPQLGPSLLQLLQVFLSRVKGGDAAEPIIDAMVKQVEVMAQQAAQQAQMGPPPDPKAETEKIKAGAEQFRAQADIAKTKLGMVADQQKHEQTMQGLEAEVRADAMKAAMGPKEGAPA